MYTRTMRSLSDLFQQRITTQQVGMSKFHKPKKNPGEGPHYDELARVAVTRALQDCCLKPSDIEQARKHAPRLPFAASVICLSSFVLVYSSLLFRRRPSLATCLLVAEPDKDLCVRAVVLKLLIRLLPLSICAQFMSHVTQMQWAFLIFPFTTLLMPGGCFRNM